MTAVIEEVTVLHVRCPECGGSTQTFTSRREAEAAADGHDEKWHVPVYDDELVP